MSYNSTFRNEKASVYECGSRDDTFYDFIIKLSGGGASGSCCLLANGAEI